MLGSLERTVGVLPRGPCSLCLGALPQRHLLHWPRGPSPPKTPAASLPALHRNRAIVGLAWLLLCHGRDPAGQGFTGTQEGTESHLPGSSWTPRSLSACAHKALSTAAGGRVHEAQSAAARGELVFSQGGTLCTGAVGLTLVSSGVRGVLHCSAAPI